MKEDLEGMKLQIQTKIMGTTKKKQEIMSNHCKDSLVSFLMYFSFFFIFRLEDLN